jgi:hypothetical protein
LSNGAYGNGPELVAYPVIPMADRSLLALLAIRVGPSVDFSAGRRSNRT